MPLSQEEACERVDTFSRELRSHGFRLTHQRLEVVREVASTDSHPDVDCVFRGVRHRVPTVSLDTVYRTLGTLADLGLVHRVSGPTAAARYDANTTRHHHFICTRCGLIGDIQSNELEGLRLPASATELGDVESVEVRFTGVCRTCAELDRT